MILIAFFWSIFPKLRPCENSHPTRVLNFRAHFDELNIRDFDISNRLKCSDVYRLEKLNEFSINFFELTFHQEQNRRKHKLFPVKISKNNSNRVVHLLIFKN